jgi:LDH2 family malate/lactate/ureidoglycolate dehydrogenase
VRKGQENLIPFSERTEEEARENGRKGGKASGAARRRKADLRRMAQDILDGTYTDKNGKPFTGAELIQNGLLANLGNPNSKNWGKAMDIFIQLTGANMSPEQKAKLKAETQLAKAKAKAADPKQAVSTVNDNFLEALNATAEEDDWSDNDDDTSDNV